MKIEYVYAPVKPLEGERWASLKINSRSEYYISTMGRLYSVFSNRLLKGKNMEGNRVFDYVPTMDRCPVPMGRLPGAAIYRKRLPKSRRKTPARFSITFSRLVAYTFLPQPTPKHILVVHRNYDKNINEVTNLAWMKPANMMGHSRHSPQYRESIRTRTRGRVLTADQVKKIRELLKPPRKMIVKDIAKAYGVSAMQIYRIQNGDLWGNVEGYRKEKEVLKKFTSVTIRKIRTQLKKMKGIEVAALHNTSPSVISRIKRNKYYKCL